MTPFGPVAKRRWHLNWKQHLPVLGSSPRPQRQRTLILQLQGASRRRCTELEHGRFGPVVPTRTE